MYLEPLFSAYYVKRTLIIIYINKLNRAACGFHFFTPGGIITFVSSCEFNGLVSESRRIPPVALFLSALFQPCNFSLQIIRSVLIPTIYF